MCLSLKVDCEYKISDVGFSCLCFFEEKKVAVVGIKL